MNVSKDLKIFNKLFCNHQKQFIRFAHNYVRDMSIAEDIVADAFVYYWENRLCVTRDTNIPAYILTTVKHKCLNYLEHLQVKRDASEKIFNHTEWELQVRISTLEAFDPHEVFTQEIQSIVEKTIASLPKQTQRIFAMSRNEHLPHAEIARQLGITTKGVEFHINKALKVLRHNLSDYLPAVLCLLIYNILRSFR